MFTFEKGSVNKNILKKNQNGGTKKRHISGNSTTVWYFGTCKTETSYRTIPIGDTLLNLVDFTTLEILMLQDLLNQVRI